MFLGRYQKARRTAKIYWQKSSGNNQGNMTKETAGGLSTFELAEMAIDLVEEFEGKDPVHIAETWDRCDLLWELENVGAFD